MVPLHVVAAQGADRSKCSSAVRYTTGEMQALAGHRQLLQRTQQQQRCRSGSRSGGSCSRLHRISPGCRGGGKMKSDLEPNMI